MAVARAVRFGRQLWILPLTALALTAGCSGEKNDSRYQSAQRVCGGISKESAKTLEDVSSTKQFTSSLNTTEFELPASLPDELDGKVTPKQHLLCRIEPQNVPNEQSIGITFEVLSKMPPPPNKSLRGNSYYKTGLRAEASQLGAKIWFKCVQKNTEGSKEPIIYTHFTYWPPNGLVSQEGNMRLVNEMSYRLAQQLNCLQGSGLTAGMPPAE